MSSVGIFYFSGTGNTEIVSELLEQAFKDRGVDAGRFKIEDILNGEAQVVVQSYDIVGVGHPIHGFDAPWVVYDFVARLPLAEGKRAFVFKTAGGPETINHSASKSLIARLQRKGYEVFYDRLFYLSSNWVYKQSAPLVKRLYNAAVEKAAHMSEEILAGKERVLRPGTFLRVLARAVGLSEALGARFFGKDLHVSDACTDCGKCIDNCPMRNISRDNGAIRFGWRCVWCMRCIYACPQQAISPRFAGFCVVKDGYDIRRAVRHPDVEEDEASAGDYHAWVQYLQNVEI
jgi:flavodoxin/ferredoxin